MVPLRTLLHPLWLVSLALLVLNDRVLKGAHLLPGVITGKLSDVTGLLVAPALLAVLLRARGRRSVLAAWVLTCVGFAAIKVSPAASSLYELLLRWLPARNVVDPTDLVALVALPVGWRVFVPFMERPAPVGHVHRLVAMAGGVACVATSDDRPGCPEGMFDAFYRDCRPAFRAALFANNRGTTDVSLSVRTVLPASSFRCADLAATPASQWPCLLHDDDLSTPDTVSLAPEDNAGLGGDLDGCSLAVVAIGGQPAQLLVRQHVGAGEHTSLVPEQGSFDITGGIGIAGTSAELLTGHDALTDDVVSLTPFTCAPTP